MNISVCMATFNGELYIKRQIISILRQLREEDELIIVDDASKDRTAEIINGIDDCRIRLYKNDYNMGFLKSFQKSLSLAEGEIIFLSDQDDIWIKDKVVRVKTIFAQSDVDIVFHDAILIDGTGKVLFNSFEEIRNISINPIRNFISNTFTGCCMAFRKSIVKNILPIPSKVVYHDRWIAIIGGLIGLKIKYYREPLIYYVRHGNNVSPMQRRNLLLILLDRLKLLAAIVFFFLNKIRRKIIRFL